MKNVITYLIAVFTACAIGGCATAGSDFSTNAISSLRIGATTPLQTKSLLGEPHTEEVASLNDTEAVIYSYLLAKQSLPAYTRMNKKQLFMEFSRNILNGYIYNNSFPDSSSNFDEGKRTGLVMHKTTKEEARSLMGTTAGEVRLPTNLFTMVGGERYAKNAPGDAKQALVYCHAYSEDTKDRRDYINYYKVMILFFDAKGVLLDTTFAENVKKK